MRQADKIAFSTFRPKNDAAPYSENRAKTTKTIVVRIFMFHQTTRRKATNAEARKPGNEPHVHCPAYNLIRNSSNKAYY